MYNGWYLSLGIKSIAYTMKNPEQKAKSREKKFRKLVDYARKNSPYYAELYKDIGDDYKIEDLPSVNKVSLMEHYDDWATDRRITNASLSEFMADFSNRNKKFLKTYSALATSGSTGHPVYFCGTIRMKRWIEVISFTRLFKWNFPVATVCDDGGFSLDNGMISQNVAVAGKAVDLMARLIEATMKPNDIVKALNEYKPKSVVGYPGTLMLLLDETCTEELTARPKLVVTGGEYLSDFAKTKLEGLFHCPVYSVYACTEAGVMAISCEHNHLHIMDDNVILEPIDENGNKLPNGVLSDRMYMTNLSSFAHPFIRYEVTDRVVLHDEDCPCGRKGQWLEVEGRSSDILHFTGENGNKVGISPMSMLDCFEEIETVDQYQAVLHPGNRLELRLTVRKGFDKQECYEKVAREFEKYLTDHGVVGLKCYLSENPPMRNPKTRKFKQAYEADE